MEFSNIIKIIKTKRGFNASKYLEDKTSKINKFFTENKLDSAVIGLSGGIDSSLVYALLIHASTKDDSPIKRIVGVTMPIYGYGTTNQKEATSKASLLESLNNDKSKIINVDLTEAYNAYIRSSYNNKSVFNGSDWSHGQLASVVRTPCLYHHAAMLQASGYKSIVVGTTNRDEGSYIGFFGKASDAMVDLQPIADIHKSEVYEVSKLLNIPQPIIDATPMGDVHDGRVDEEMIGAPYWFLEMYLLMKEYDLEDFSNELSKEDYDLFFKYSNNIESLHNKNHHKYNHTNEFIEPRGFASYVDCIDHKLSY